MRRHRKILPYTIAFVAVTAAGAPMLAPQARANLVFDGTIDVTGFGFGSHPRALTVDNHNASTVEFGCIAPNGSGGLVAGAGACASDPAAPGGNEANPIGFPKQGAPSLGSLGITNASQIQVVFDAVQPQNNSTINVDDVTLKLYSSTGALLATASGSHSGLSTPGNGSTDYLFTLDAPEAAEFNATGLAGSDLLALDAALSFPGVGGGAESFAIFSSACTLSCGGVTGSVPEPGSLGLLGGALTVLAAAWKARRGRL